MRYKLIIILNILALGHGLFAEEIPTVQSNLELQQTVHEFVMTQLESQSIMPEDVIVTVTPLDQRLKLEPCHEPLNPVIEYGSVSQKNITVKLACSTPKAWTVRLPVKIQHFQPVLVASQQILRDQIISSQDVKMLKQDVNQISEGYFQNEEMLIGLVAQKNIAPGTVIKQHMVKPAILVKRGEAVKVIIRGPGLEIMSTGVALMDGIKGQTIKIKNHRSQKIVESVVTDPGVTVIPL